MQFADDANTGGYKFPLVVEHFYCPNEPPELERVDTMQVRKHTFSRGSMFVGGTGKGVADEECVLAHHAIPHLVISSSLHNASCTAAPHSGRHRAQRAQHRGEGYGADYHPRELERSRGHCARRQSRGQSWGRSRRQSRRQSRGLCQQHGRRGRGVCTQADTTAATSTGVRNWRFDWRCSFGDIHRPITNLHI